jgi:hypothetical protein
MTSKIPIAVPVAPLEWRDAKSTPAVPRKTTADKVITTAIARRTPTRSSTSHVYPVSSKVTQASASPLTTPGLPLNGQVTSWLLLS